MSRAATPSSHVPSVDRILPGIGLMLVFCIVAPLIDVASKIAVQTVSPGVVTLARFLVQAALMAPIVLLMRLPMRMNASIARLILLRALANIGSTICFVAAVRVMPIADALAVTFLSPFILLLMGRFLLGEQVGARRIAASVVAFCGAMLVIQPSFARFGATALLPVGCAFFFALYMLVTRHLSREQHPVTMQLNTALAASLICITLLSIGTAADIEPFSFVLPAGTIWLACLAVGAAATVSHLAITYALSLAPSSTLAPLNYLEIVTGTIFGFLFFGDFPGGMIWTGIAVIVSSGLYVINRERALARLRLPRELAR
ncbi:DMT family transporter [Tianweitania sediminis]|uniref:DMT family transporter n=1 Tax=Tianweitania sediminis TaxID=1502156 RepID=A0A8J7UIM8_9HYPH|nr:DMT family transporter [Tianweitania sediminis]MBP0437985.1 DMT family transporter [Tianweitania sediminis]